MPATNRLSLALAPLLTLGALTVAAPAHAQGYAFLQQAPIRDFQDGDLQLMQETLREALDTKADGESVQWTNLATGNSGMVTALKAAAPVPGKDCRAARILNRTPQATGESEHRFCRDEKGEWKVE